jgi:hypothetical protein
MIRIISTKSSNVMYVQKKAIHGEDLGHRKNYLLPTPTPFDVRDGLTEPHACIIQSFRDACLVSLHTYLQWKLLQIQKLSHVLLELLFISVDPSRSRNSHSRKLPGAAIPTPVQLRPIATGHHGSESAPAGRKRSSQCHCPSSAWQIGPGAQPVSLGHEERWQVQSNDDGPLREALGSEPGQQSTRGSNNAIHVFGEQVSSHGPTRRNPMIKILIECEKLLRSRHGSV